MLKSVIKKCIPKSVRESLREHMRAEFLEEQQLIREQAQKNLPWTPLKQTHVENCAALLNRVTLLEKLKKGSVCAELGVKQGEFSEQILSVVQPAKLHLVDTWGSAVSHEGFYNSVREKFSAEIERGQVEIHRKLSIEAVQDFPENYFDWIYIDTDHSYLNTKAELHQYAEKLKPSGVICGHDFVKTSWLSGSRYGVTEAVQEFCVTYGWEFIYITIDATENTSFAIQKKTD